MARRRSSARASDGVNRPSTGIDGSIRTLRGEKVMLSPDLARLYEVETRALVQAVKRNRKRFPPDFMFRLTPSEWSGLKSQSVISSWGGSRRATAYAFTEEGVAMLSAVLRSTRALAVSVEIMRAFVRLRRLVVSHADLARRLDDLEGTYDAQFKVVFEAIRGLMDSADSKTRRRIGFRAAERETAPS
jgi:hypothetical protein